MSESKYTTLPLKTCTKCGDTKTHGEFSRRSGTKDGLRPQCKVCAAAYQAAYNAAHREEIAASGAAYRAAHREERAELDRKHYAEHREEKLAYAVTYRDEHREETAAYCAAHRDERAAYRAGHRGEAAAYHAAYYAAHRDEKAAYHAAYYTEHRDEMAAHQAAHRAAHPESVRAGNHNRRARQQGNGGTHTPADIRAQYARQNGRCYWQATDVCRDRRGKLDDEYHVDHVMPLILGGSNGPENLVIACPTCNLSKGAKHPQDFCGRLL